MILGLENGGYISMTETDPTGLDEQCTECGDWHFPVCPPSPATVECDGCKKQVSKDELRYGMMKRPSDQREYVCVLWGCADCFPDFETAAELTEWFESGDAYKEEGLLWLTI
jgi:hypothetical protein